MDTNDDIELHDLTSIEENLSTEREPDSEAADGFMISSACGFMIS